MSLAASLCRTSANKKLSPVKKVPYDNPRYPYRPVPVAPFVSSTYSSIAATCPSSCAFKRRPDGSPGGCYVDADHFMRKKMATLDAAAAGKAPLDVVRDEAAEIDRAWPRGIPQDGARGGRDLRLHIGGEFFSEIRRRIAAGERHREIAASFHVARTTVTAINRGNNWSAT